MPVEPSHHPKHHDDPSSWLPAWHPATLAAYAWGRMAIREAHQRAGLDTELRPPPRWLPDRSRRGVHAALYRTGSRCLVSARVRQTWERAHGTDRELVIGVTAPASGFRAHAWLDGDPPCCSEDFTELLRR